MDELFGWGLLAGVSMAAWYAIALFGHPMSAWLWCETLRLC